MSRSSGNSGWLLIHANICVIIVAFMQSASAQDGDELRFLVFEPVLIESITVDDQLPPQIEELTRLPESEHTVSVSEYFLENQPRNTLPENINLEESIALYEQNIGDLELQGGAYEPALSQELLSVSSLYQAQGEHEQALEYLDQALHINRVNLGLFNLDQEAIIEEKVESYVALGDLQAADTQQEYLFYLKRKAYGSTSVELLPALKEYADWNIFAFDARLSMNPALGYTSDSNVYASNLTNNPMEEEDFKTIRLVNAQNIYRMIIKILLSNYGINDPRILDMERNLALTNYFFATNLNISTNVYSNNNSTLAMQSSQGFYDMSRVSANSMGYRHGREALERRLEYMRNMEGLAPEEIAKAQIELADWLLLFKKRMSSLNAYQEAYDEFKAAGAPQKQIDELFHPPFPDVIPTFIDYSYTRLSMNIPDDQALDYQGYFDVRIHINRYGQPQDVEIFNRSVNSSDPVESRLLRHLRNYTSFRPRFSDDKLLEEETIEARYYYSY